MTTLKSVLESTQNWLASRRPTGSLPGLLEPLDVQRIARTLELERVGADRGRREIPRTEHAGFDEVEQQVVQELTTIWTMQRGEVIGTIKALRDNIARFSVATQLAQLRLAAQAAIARFTGARQDIRGELSRLHDDAVTATNELRRFREKHRLHRSARDPAHRWTTYGLLLFLIALESILNGTFFARGSDLGLIGGIGMAIGISGFNVVASFVAGLGPARYCAVRSITLRLLAMTTTVSLLASLVALHLFAAHYREAVASTQDAGGAQSAFAGALSTLFTTPWALHDMSSLYLFGVGVLFAFSAAWKGFHLDDPYPGYGRVSRSARQAEVAYDEAYRDLFGQLELVRDDTIERFSTALSNMPVEAQQADSARSQAATLAKQLGSYEDHLEESANTLLSIYREANRAARTTPAPRRFDDRWRLAPRTHLPDAGPVPSDPVALDAALAEIKSLHDGVLSHYRELLTEADHPESLRMRLR